MFCRALKDGKPVIGFLTVVVSIVISETIQDHHCNDSCQTTFRAAENCVTVATPAKETRPLLSCETLAVDLFLPSISTPGKNWPTTLVFSLNLQWLR